MVPGPVGGQSSWGLSGSRRVWRSSDRSTMPLEATADGFVATSWWDIGSQRRVCLRGRRDFAGPMAIGMADFMPVGISSGDRFARPPWEGLKEDGMVIFSRSVSEWVWRYLSLRWSNTFGASLNCSMEEILSIEDDLVMAEIVMLGGSANTTMEFFPWLSRETFGMEDIERGAIVGKAWNNELSIWFTNVSHERHVGKVSVVVSLLFELVSEYTLQLCLLKSKTPLRTCFRPRIVRDFPPIIFEVYTQSQPVSPSLQTMSLFFKEPFETLSQLPMLSFTSGKIYMTESARHQPFPTYLPYISTHFHLNAPPPHASISINILSNSCNGSTKSLDRESKSSSTALTWSTVAGKKFLGLSPLLLLV